MDKITKNPDSAKLTDSPRTSVADSQIEKYRLEISKKSESDFINTRKLTIQSTVKHEALESGEIDKQISDLENLIRRLQDEIVEMSNSADKPYVSAEDDDPPVEIKESRPAKGEDEPHESKDAEDVTDTKTRNSHVYPVIVRDVALNPNDQYQKFADQVSDLVNYSGPSEETNTMQAKLSSIRRNFDNISIKTNPNDDMSDVEQKAAQDDYHLQKLIGELKTEICETLETLKDVSDGEPLNNSEENVNLSLGPN